MPRREWAWGLTSGAGEKRAGLLKGIANRALDTRPFLMVWTISTRPPALLPG